MTTSSTVDGFSPVTALNFSVRTRKFLERHNIQDIRDLIRYSPDELLALRTCGKTIVGEIEQRLSVAGFALKYPPLTPERALWLAEKAAPSEQSRAVEFIPAMLVFLAKGWSPTSAAGALIEWGCKVPAEDLIAAVLTKMGR